MATLEDVTSGGMVLLLTREHGGSFWLPVVVGQTDDDTITIAGQQYRRDDGRLLGAPVYHAAQVKSYRAHHDQTDLAARFQALVEANAKLRGALVGLVGSDNQTHLDLLEASVRVSPRPNEDLLIAIDVIRETRPCEG